MCVCASEHSPPAGRFVPACGHNPGMRAETVIATHGNTDFDAFAAMLAARRLYPNAVACIAGSLNRNVREFARLHAPDPGPTRLSVVE
jgi:hypothetical protein